MTSRQNVTEQNGPRIDGSSRARQPSVEAQLCALPTRRPEKAVAACLPEPYAARVFKKERG